MALSSLNRTRVIAAMKAKVPFEYSSISGWTARGDGDLRTGDLPEPYLQMLLSADKAGEVEFVVMSYRTPIAWILKNGLVMVPEVTYSFTTSQHQRIVEETLCR
jgi:hypothetical protein